MFNKNCLIKIILFATIAMTIVGCQKEKKERVVVTPRPGVNIGIVSKASISDGASSSSISIGKYELQDKSKRFAEQIASGNMDSFYDALSSNMKKQHTKESLLESWKSVEGDIGSFEAVDDVKKTEEADGIVCVVSMRYSSGDNRIIKFTYNTEKEIKDVWFDIGDEVSKTTISRKVGREPYTLDGTLNMPSGVTKPKIAIIISGVDDMDQNGTIGAANNMPLKDIADGLAEKGVATFRYNKRMNQYASICSKDAGIYEKLIEDALYAIDAMYNERKVDSDKIYLILHGKAADYAAAIVEKKKNRLCGVALMAGKPIITQEVDYLDGKKNVVSDAKYFMRTNSTVPMFILQGDSDYETAPAYYEQWQKILKGRSHITYHLFNKTNHWFMKTSGNKDFSDYDEEKKINPDVIKELYKWIDKN